MATTDRSRRRDRRREIRFAARRIHHSLVDWGPIGGAPDDEYDCMIWPIMSRLASGTDVDSLAQWLMEHTEQHLGIEPEQPRERALAQSLVDQWALQR